MQNNISGGKLMDKVYVVVKEWYGTILDVEVYKKEPTNLEPMDINGDVGDRCFELELQESQQ